MTAAGFATALLNFCDATGGSVQDYIRSAARARRRTGGDHCPHRYGIAADVVYDVPAPLEATVARAESFGLRLERGIGYDHVEPLGWTAPGELPACVAITAGIKKPGVRVYSRTVAAAARERSA